MNRGMPRIGPGRELKRAVEGYWAGALGADALAAVAAQRRADAWRAQAETGVEEIPSNDFSLYDQMLDTCCMVGAVPGPWPALTLTSPWAGVPRARRVPCRRSR